MARWAKRSEQSSNYLRALAKAVLVGLLTFPSHSPAALSEGATEVDVLALATANESQLKSFPGNGHVAAVIPDIHFPDLLQLVLLDFDWGAVSYNRREDNHTIGLETVTVNFKIPAITATDVLVKLNLTSSTVPEKMDSGSLRWAKLPCGSKQVDVVVAPGLKTATVYICPYCSNLIETNFANFGTTGR